MANRTTRILVAVIGLLVVAVVGYGVLSATSGESERAPGFEVTLYSGGHWSLAEAAGQVVVLNFWASWCGPCREEAPALQRVWQEYQGRGVLLIGITVSDVREKALAFADRAGITYPIAPDPYGRIASAYGTTGVPETFIIGRDGRIVSSLIGAVSERQLRAAIDAALE